MRIEASKNNIILYLDKLLNIFSILNTDIIFVRNSNERKIFKNTKFSILFKGQIFNIILKY